jgi:hypothetical protein
VPRRQALIRHPLSRRMPQWRAGLAVWALTERETSGNYRHSGTYAATAGPCSRSVSVWFRNWLCKRRLRRFLKREEATSGQ